MVCTGHPVLPCRDRPSGSSRISLRDHRHSHHVDGRSGNRRQRARAVDRGRRYGDAGADELGPHRLLQSRSFLCYATAARDWQHLQPGMEVLSVADAHRGSRPLSDMLLDESAPSVSTVSFIRNCLLASMRRRPSPGPGAHIVLQINRNWRATQNKTANSYVLEIAI